MEKEEHTVNDERRTPVRADELDNLALNFCVGYFFVVLIAAFFIGTHLGPNMYERLAGKDQCILDRTYQYKPSEKAEGPCKKLELTRSSFYLGFIDSGKIKDDWIRISMQPYAQFYTDQDEDNKFFIEYDMYVYRLNDDWSYSSERPLYVEGGKFQVHCISSLQLNEKSNPNSKTHREIKCGKSTIARLADMNDHKHRIDIIFRNRPELVKKISMVEMEFDRVSENYLAYVTALRYLFCVVSLVLVIIYSFKFVGLPEGYEVTFEQKFLKILGFSLFAFNDPLTLFNLLDPFYLSPIIVSLEMSFFLIILMIFWLTMFERINRETFSPSTYVMSIWKIIISIVLGLLLCFAAIFTAYSYLYDPGFTVEFRHPDAYLYFYYIVCVVFGACFMYIGAQTIVFWGKKDKVPIRHQAFFRFSIMCLVVLVIAVYMGWFNYYQSGGAAFTTIIFTFNVYIYTLFWYYKPPDFEEDEDEQPGSGRQAKKLRRRRKKKEDGAMELADVSQSYIDDSMDMGGRLDESGIDIEANVDGKKDDEIHKITEVDPEAEETIRTPQNDKIEDDFVENEDQDDDEYEDSDQDLPGKDDKIDVEAGL